MMIGNSSEKHKASKRACTTCRQSKIRCNGAETFPAPCTNCQRLKKECRSDATFKRTPVRGRLEEVTRQLDRIKRVQSYQIDDGPLSPSSSLASGHLATPASSGNEGLVPQLDAATAFGLDQLDLNASQVSSQSLETFYLSGIEIAALFKKFAHLYLFHLPILDTRMSINVLHETNPLLFWTIVLISSRHTEALIEPFKNLLARQLTEPVRSLYTIHALLLFCLWPLPVRKQIVDSSWNYCGFATSAAIRMGLHQLEATFEYDFSQYSAQEIEIRRRTWLGCFIVSTYLSADLGLPSLIGPAMDLETFAKPTLYNPKDPLSIQFEIERHVARFSATLNQRSGAHVRASLIQMFDRDLKSLGDEVLALSNQRLEMLFLGAKLCLYSFSILGETAATTETQHIDSSMKSIWYLGVETASRLAYLYSGIAVQNSIPPDFTVPTENSPHYSYPKHNFLILLSSGYYLLKFLSVNTETTPSEAELARNGIRLVYSTMQSWSRHSIDEAARLARIISLLANAELQGTLIEYKRINRRPPLSIVSDVMEMTAWLRAKLKREGKPNPAPAGTGEAGVAVEPAPAERLVMEPVLLDDEALWEGLDEWLRLEGDVGNFLLPYSDGDFAVN